MANVDSNNLSSDIVQAATQQGIDSVLLMVHALKEQMDSMDRFVRRRFDEISMEINATSQQLEMTEEGMVGKFVEIMEILSAVSYRGDGSSAANTGVELEAVIQTTEEAANKIMDAADRIANRIHAEGQWDESQNRERLLEETRSDIQDILMACTFQDLTGQRIRKTLDSLQQIEGRLSTTLQKFGIEIKPERNELVRDSIENHATSQADIDALFS